MRDYVAGNWFHTLHVRGNKDLAYQVVVYCQPFRRYGWNMFPHQSIRREKVERRWDHVKQLFIELSIEQPIEHTWRTHMSSVYQG